MGCHNSKRKSAYTRLAKYQQEANLEGEAGLKKVPTSLKLLNNNTESVSVREFHNLLYDGCYAPYLRNPNYLLLIDTRDPNKYDTNHIITARRYGKIKEDGLQRFAYIVLYDADGTSIDDPNSDLSVLYHSLSHKHLSPVFIAGGYNAVARDAPYMLVPTDRSKQMMVDWYPSMLLDGTLYLGRLEQALNPTVIQRLGISHVLCVMETRPGGRFRNVNYMVVPLSENKDVELLTNLPSIIEFIAEAIKEGGRVLVHCDQGVNRGAIVCIAYLMNKFSCTLDDALYYVKELRSGLLPSEGYLKRLIEYEAQLYGRQITDLDELDDLFICESDS